MSGSAVLSLYRGATAALGPIADAWLSARVRAGKEDGARIDERRGHARAARPPGPLVWLHGASVGEMGVARLLIDALARERPGLSFLVTTGTRTSAELFAKRPPPGATHAYVPLDRPGAARRFIAHWRPDLGVFVESDLWPNLILEAERAGVRLALVNARMSVRTLARWTAWPGAARRLLGAFSTVIAADKRTGEALSQLLDAPAPMLGNLKLAAPVPHVDPAARAALAEAIGARKTWLAASTHAGEDEIVLAAHAALRREFPDALLILAPRHPERGADVAALAHGAPRRSLAQPVGQGPVYVFDTLGELGAAYAVSPCALIAGSLLPRLKGHNPAEAALFDCVAIAGPHVESFADVYEDFFAADAALRASNADELAAAVRAVWTDPARAGRVSAAARTVVARGAAALDETVSRLSALLPQSAHAAA